jgi:ankyrin repeat protein
VAPLHRCLEHNLLAAAAALIEAGVDLTQRTLVSGHTPLLSAVQFRRHTMLPALLAGGADVKTTTTAGRSALSLSLRHFNDEDVNTTLLLVANGADVNARNAENGHLTPLLELIRGAGSHNAAVAAKIARALLDRGADPAPRALVPAAQSPTGHELPALRSAFLEALSTGLDEVAEAIALLPQAPQPQPQPQPLSLPLQPLLPAEGAAAAEAVPQPNDVVRCILNRCPRAALVLLARGGDASAECEVNHELPLRAAAAINSTSLVAELLQRGARIDATVNASLETALHVAVNKRHRDVAKALLAAGADPNARTATGDTALTLAASNCPDLVGFMVGRLVAAKEAAERATAEAAAAEAAATKVPSAGAAAAEAEAAEAAAKAAAERATPMGAVAGVEVGQPMQEQGEPASAPATTTSSHEILVDLNARRKRDGKQALEILLETSRGELTEALVRAGACFADAVLVSNGGRGKIIYTAFRYGHFKTVEAMLERGAPPNDILAHGQTVAHLAVQHGSLSLLEAFVRAGGDLEAPDSNGLSTLKAAVAYHSWAAAVALLTRLGARVNARELLAGHLNVDVRRLL